MEPVTKKVNHRCIVCGEGYYHCNDCSNMKSFTPWRSVACSAECYQAYLAYLEYRDQTKDAKLFAEQIDRIGVSTRKLPESFVKTYRLGRKERAKKEIPVLEEPRPIASAEPAILIASLMEEGMNEASNSENAE